MKVLFLSQIVPYPPHGGVLQRGYNILREIARNHDVHLLGFVHRDILKNERQIERSKDELGRFCSSVEYYELWTKLSSINLSIAVLMSLLSTSPFSVIAHRSQKLVNRLRELVTNGNFDVIHFDTIGLAGYKKYTSGIPSVLTHHNIESQLMERRAAVEKWPARTYIEIQARKLLAYESRMSSTFDINIVMSENDKQTLRRISPAVETMIVPNGADVNYFVPNSEEHDPALIYTGGLNMFANRDAVIYFVDQIWPLVKQKVPNVRFDIVGQDPPAELIAKAHSDEGLRIHGYVNDVRPLVARAAVYIVPIRVGGGTRLKVLDAMAQGKAIVSTTVGCEGIGVTPGRDIELEDDPKSFAHRVVDLLGDVDRRRSLGANARRLAETHYAWGPIAKHLESAYKQAIDKVERTQGKLL